MGKETDKLKKPDNTPVGYMFDGQLENVSKNKDGSTSITIKTNSNVNYDILDLFGQQVECAVKKIKAKKSVNANNYCWELCAQISVAIGVGSVDVYRQALRERGVYKDYEIPEDKVEEANKAWSNNGIGWFTERVDNAVDNKVILRCYYGTSSYNSAQLSRIIDFLTEEANDLGLTTLSNKRKEALINKWVAVDPIQE